VTDLQELKRHIRLLEDRFRSENDIAKEIGELSDRVGDVVYALDETTTALAAALAGIRAAIDRNTDKLNELAQRKDAEALP
jgi:hypothetical protein